MSPERVSRPEISVEAGTGQGRSRACLRPHETVLIPTWPSPRFPADFYALDRCEGSGTDSLTASAITEIEREGRPPSRAALPKKAAIPRESKSPLLDKAAVRAIRVHDARCTYASLMLRRGVPIAYVSRQLGHSSIQITVDLYGHFVPGGGRHHAEGLAAAIEAERSAAEARALPPHPDSFAAPDGTLAAPG